MTRNAPAWIGLTVLAAAGCYLAGVHALGIGRDIGGDAATRLAGALALLSVISGAALLGLRDRVDHMLRHTVAWAAVVLAAIVIFAYRAEIYEIGGPLVAEAIPLRVVTAADDPGATAHQAAPSSSQLAVISAGRGGHFFVEALVNGSHVQLVADTGATLVTLTAEDARRIGFDEADLEYSNRVQTANGVAMAAFVVLDQITVGPITIADVPASVAQPGMLARSLLGMSFLSELSSFHLRGDQLVLEQ